MASKLPPSDIDIKANVFTRHRRYGAIQGEDIPRQGPWSKWGWSLFVPLAFAGNVVVAIFAWFVVALVMG
jgi:hypothetical protein